MNCYEIEVRGVSFIIWAPTIHDALETFMIDMEFYEVPKQSMTEEFWMPEDIPGGF